MRAPQPTRAEPWTPPFVRYHREMAKPVFFLGGAQTDFARNLAREQLELADLVREVTLGALEDAGLGARAVQSVHVGNAFGELFTGQAQMGALPATVVRELDGVPASRHEGACASGSLALLAAAAEIEAGRYDCVLVVGAEQERNVPGEIAARHLGAAAWTGHEALDARYVWPSMFSRITDTLLERSPRGPTRPHLSAIARKNFANAKDNPFAQTRSWLLYTDRPSTILVSSIRHQTGRVRFGRRSDTRRWRAGPDPLRLALAGHCSGRLRGSEPAMQR